MEQGCTLMETGSAAPLCSLNLEPFPEETSPVTVKLHFLPAGTC